MTVKKPLVLNGGQIEQIQEGDTVSLGGLFEIDIIGGLMPVTDTVTDIYYELDGNGDIQPISV